MKAEQFRGFGIALATPFDNDKNVDYNALEKLIKYNLDGGVDYLVVLGTTAETATLKENEKEKIIDFVCDSNKGKVPIVLGIGGNCTESIIRNLEKDYIKKIDGILSVSPYYNRPSQEGIFQHYSEIAKSTDKPIILYNVPSRTSSNILPETTLRLANEHENIVGIKEASGDLIQAKRIIKDRPKDFLVLSGEDLAALPMTLAGGDGVISVIGQAYPEKYKKMISTALTLKNIEDCYEIYYELMEITDLIFEEGNPAGIKALLSIKNLCSSNLRLPIVEVSTNLKLRLKETDKNII